MAAGDCAGWEQLTGAEGGEGMVVKPVREPGSSRGRRGLVQPAPQGPRPGVPADRLRPGVHRAESNLERLRQRRHWGTSAPWQLREHALGLESLERAFATGEPLWRVHEAVFATLALESDPIDPRL